MPPVAESVALVAAQSAYGPSSPNGVSAPTTRCGWRDASSRASSPGASSTPELTSTSECASSSSNRSTSAASVRSSTTPRLPALRTANASDTSLRTGARLRAGEPPGGSTFTTSAPRSPSRRAVSSPRSTVQSTTRRPDKGRGCSLIRASHHTAPPVARSRSPRPRASDAAKRSVRTEVSAAEGEEPAGLGDVEDLADRRGRRTDREHDAVLLGEAPRFDEHRHARRVHQREVSYVYGDRRRMLLRQGEELVAELPRRRAVHRSDHLDVDVARVAGDGTREHRLRHVRGPLADADPQARGRVPPGQRRAPESA